MDPGQVEPVGPRQRQAVDLGAAGDERLVVARRRRPLERLREIGAALGAGGRERRGARQDQDRAAGERPADRLPGLAADDQVVAHGQPPEAPQVRRQLPGQIAGPADDAVVGDRGDDRQPHTEIGALIAGWGWYPSSRKCG